VASFFGYFSDSDNPTLPNTEATFQAFNAFFPQIFMQLMGQLILNLIPQSFLRLDPF
jgi:hypothetical protein